MLNVLIADDETLARETVKLLLENETDIGEIYMAEDGNQALLLAETHHPQIIFLDIEMPGMSGIELARHLPPHCVVIFATEIGRASCRERVYAPV